MKKNFKLPLISSEEVQDLKDEWEDVLDNRELSKDLVGLINDTVIALKYLKRLIKTRFRR